MNKFEPKSIKYASSYLGDKLEMFKKREESKEENGTVYVIEPKKDSMIKRFVGSIFNA